MFVFRVFVCCVVSTALAQALYLPPRSLSLPDVAAMAAAAPKPKPKPRPKRVERALAAWFAPHEGGPLVLRILDFAGNEPCSRLQIMLANSHALNQAIFAQLVQRTRELQETRATLERAQREIGLARDLVEDVDLIITRAWRRGVPVTSDTLELMMDMINSLDV